MDFINFKTPVIVGCYVEDVFDISHMPIGAGVYMITETRLNMKYIGSSINVKLRLRQHLHPTSETFKKAVFIDANPRYMKVELLEDCDGLSVEQLRDREAYWIKELNTMYPNGLNVHTPKKGGSFCSPKVYKELLTEDKFLPCRQLLRFSERMDYYVEAIRKTPVNPEWFSNPTLQQLRNKREKYSHLKFADIERPLSYFEDKKGYWHPTPYPMWRPEKPISSARKHPAKNLERLSIVKMDNGLIGVLESRKILFITTAENQDIKIDADTELELIKRPVDIVKEYLMNLTQPLKKVV